MITKYIKNIFSAAVVTLSFGFLSSCTGDLDVEPIDPSTIMTVDASGLFNKCYANLGTTGSKGANDDDCDVQDIDGGTSSFMRQLWNANELTTDESICCWGDEGISAFNFNQWGSSHPMLRGFYYRLYFGVSVCNQYLTECSEYDATMTAEIRFLRALYYYYLLDNFGNVPFATSISSEKPQQISRADLYTWIESELLECVENMSEPSAKTSMSDGYGRADKSAAWMLLSRLYLNAEVYTGTAQWQKAADYAEKVINSSHKLFTAGNGTYSAYQMLFMGDNGENGSSVEALLPVLQDGTQTTSWGGTLFLIASTYKAADEEISRGTTETWAGNRARKEFVQKFFPNNNCPEGTTADVVSAAGDDRALIYSKNRQLEIDNVGEFTEGYSVTKFTNIYSDGGTSHSSQFTDTDFFLMRAAEAYLTYAEATARLSGGGSTTTQGTAYINELRNRANTSTANSYTLDQICDEWSREFYYEGRRRSDLIRFGKFGGTSDYRWQWKGGVKNGVNFDSHYNIFAIPATDLNANPNLTQNPGY